MFGLHRSQIYNMDFDYRLRGFSAPLTTVRAHHIRTHLHNTISCSNCHCVFTTVRWDSVVDFHVNNTPLSLKRTIAQCPHTHTQKHGQTLEPHTQCLAGLGAHWAVWGWRSAKGMVGTAR